MKSLITGLVLAAFISPAFAQTATEFYVVHDTSTKKCMVVDKRAQDADQQKRSQ
jgi:hypothetical protein